MKLYFASLDAGICTCFFERRRILGGGEITFILWVILGSTDTSPCHSHLTLSVLAVKVAALKTNTNKLWVGRYSSVGIATCYGLNGPGIEPLWEPLLYSEYRVSFTRVKQPGRDVDQPPPRAMMLKKEWSYSSTRPLCVQSILMGADKSLARTGSKQYTATKL